MAIGKSKYWFVSRKDLFLPKHAEMHQGIRLKRADTPVMPEIDQVVRTGSPFTIFLKGFCVTENKDDESENDLLIRSWTKYGSEPSVEVLHLLKGEIPIGNNEPLMSEHMFAVKNHQEENLVWIKLQILEVKKALTDLGKFSSIANNFESSFQNLGAPFLSVLPFTKKIFHKASGISESLSSASDLVEEIRRYLSKNNSSDRRQLFESRLDLCAAESGETPFRYGVYIFFKEETQGEKYRLREFKLEPVSIDQPLPDYMLIEVAPTVISQQGEDILINQKLAAGLPIFGQKDEGFSQEERRFDFLQNTVQKAIQFNKLLDLMKLKNKKLKTLTKSQEKKLEAFNVEINEYIKCINEILDDE